MMDLERRKRIQNIVEYISSGRTDGSMEHCVSTELAVELSGLTDHNHGDRPDPGYYCIDLGACLTGVDEDGAVTVQYPVNDAFRNGMGNLQGGVLASLIDNAMGILVVPVFGSFLTMNLDINYFAPISREFDKVMIRAEIVKPGKRTKYLRAEVYRSDGKLAALAGSNVMMVRK